MGNDCCGNGSYKNINKPRKDGKPITKTNGRTYSVLGGGGSTPTFNNHKGHHHGGHHHQGGHHGGHHGGGHQGGFFGGHHGGHGGGHGGGGHGG